MDDEKGPSLVVSCSSRPKTQRLCNDDLQEEFQQEIEGETSTQVVPSSSAPLDLDKGHPLRRFPPELIYHILSYLKEKDIENWYRALASWTNWTIIYILQDEANEYAMQRLWDAKEESWSHILGEDGCNAVIEKWNATLSLHFCSLERGQAQRQLIERLDFFQERGHWGPWAFYRSIADLGEGETPEQEAVLKVLRLYLNRMYKYFDCYPSIAPYFYKTSLEKIPLLFKIITILRDGKNPVGGHYLTDFMSKSASVLSTLIYLMDIHRGESVYWRALNIIPEDFDRSLLTLVDREIGLSGETILSTLTFSREQVEQRIDLINRVGAHVSFVGMDPGFVTLFKQYAFSLTEFGKIEPAMEFVLRHAGTLFYPPIQDVLVKRYSVEPQYVATMQDKSQAVLLFFLFQKKPGDMVYEGEQEMEYHILRRPLMIGYGGIASFGLVTAIIMKMFSDMLIFGLSFIS